MADPKIPDEQKAAMQENWAAGRDKDEAVEKKLEAGAESPEGRGLLERIRDFKRRIAEAFQDRFGRPPLEEGVLEKRYEAGMSEEEKAKDAQIVKQAENQRVDTESLLADVLNFGEARRSATATPVHEAFQNEAEKRGPEETAATPETDDAAAASTAAAEAPDWKAAEAAIEKVGAEQLSQEKAEAAFSMSRTVSTLPASSPTILVISAFTFFQAAP